MTRRKLDAYPKSAISFPTVPPRLRGALRGRHERWVRDAMDAVASQDERRHRGRQSRVVLTPRRWRQVCGAIRRRRWQESPVTGSGHQGEHVISRKPLRREGRIVSANLWRLRSCAFLFACEAMGAASTRLSLRPLFAEALRPASLGQILPRECGRISLLAV